MPAAAFGRVFPCLTSARDSNPGLMVTEGWLVGCFFLHHGVVAEAPDRTGQLRDTGMIFTTFVSSSKTATTSAAATSVSVSKSIPTKKFLFFASSRLRASAPTTRFGRPNSLTPSSSFSTIATSSDSYFDVPAFYSSASAMKKPLPVLFLPVAALRALARKKEGCRCARHGGPPA